MNPTDTPAEFAGSINYRIYTNKEFEIVDSALLHISCNVGSTNATAVLRPEYSLDGSNFFELAAVHTAGDVFIGGVTTGNPNCFTGSPALANSGAFAIANAAKTLDVLIRIVGLDGGGIGDNPIFTSLFLTLFQNRRDYTIYVNTSLSSMTITVQLAGVNIENTQTVTIDWIAER